MYFEVLFCIPESRKWKNYTQPTFPLTPSTSWQEDKITEDMYLPSRTCTFPPSLLLCSLFLLPPTKPVFPPLLALSWAQLKGTTINRRRKQSFATHDMGSVVCSDLMVARSSRGRMNAWSYAVGRMGSEAVWLRFHNGDDNTAICKNIDRSRIHRDGAISL